jgi:hypothetical protein
MMRQRPSPKEFALLRERNFGEVLNQTVAFVHAYSRPFYRALLYLVIPVAALYGILTGLYLSEAGSFFNTFSVLDGGQGEAPVLFYIGALALSLTENMLILSVVYAFFSLLHRGVALPEVAEIWAEAKSRMLPAFWGLALSVLGIIILFSVVSVFIGAVAASINNGAGLFLMFILMLALFIGAIYAATLFSMVVPSIIIERKGPFDAMQRSINLVMQSWGQTFLVLLIAYIALGSMAMLFNVPNLALSVFLEINTLEGAAAAEGLVKFLFLLFSLVATLGGALVMPIFHACNAIQFFNLVEKQEGLGMQALIASFGQSANDPNQHEEDE